MSTWLILVLFGVNSLLVLAMLIILLSVLKQGKRIAGLAKEAQALAEHAAEHADMEEPLKETES